MTARGRAGRTLIELIIASALMLMITAACAVALHSSIRYFRRVEALSEMENRLTSAMGLLAREGGESAIRSFYWEPTPGALTFASPRDMSGALTFDHAAGNRLLFSRMIRYQVDPVSKDLVRLVAPIPTPIALAPHPIDSLTPPMNATFWADPSRERRVLAKGVADFTVEGVYIDTLSSAENVTTKITEGTLLRVALKLEQKFDKVYGVEVKLEIVPKN